MSEWEPPEEFDDYVIEKPLGGGAMGRVFLAQDAVLARPVAVKFIASVEPDSASRQRFLLEARATALQAELETRFDLPAGAGRLYGEPVGIDHVLVNGTTIVTDGRPTGALPGTLLRSGRDTTSAPTP